MRTTTSTASTATGALHCRHIMDRDEWNGIVAGFAAHDVKQGFEWGELRSEHGWPPTRLAVFRGDESVAACALLTRAVPGLGAVMYAPRGPLFRPDEPEALDQLIAAMRQLGRASGAIVVRMSPGVRLDEQADAACLAQHGLVSLPEPWTTWNTPRFVQVLDLGPDEKTLLGGMRRRMREYITAAPRKGLVIEATDRDEDLAAFHALMLNVGRIKGFPVRDVGYYRSLIRRYREAGACTLLVARTADAVVGGLLAVRFGRRAYLLYTSVRSNAVDTVRHHVAPAISWEFARRARAEGCELADFGGSGVQLPPRETDAGWGVYHFKAGLGCRLETFVPFHDLVLRPALYRGFRLLETKVLPQMWTLVARVPTLAPRFA